MLEIKRAVSADLQDIYDLWGAEFGDGPEFIDAFCGWCGLNQVLILREDGEAKAMVAVPIIKLAMPDGGAIKGGYIYALTTKREERGKGFGHMILQYADFCLQNQKIPCATVVPAQASLFDFFRTAGFAPAFYLWEGTIEAQQLPRAEQVPVPVTAEEYFRIQELQLSGRPHMLSPVGLIEQQKKLCCDNGGDLYKLELANGLGCGAVSRMQDGGVFVHELLVPEGGESEALGMLHRKLDGLRYQVRRPLAGDEANEATPQVRPFGGVRWYNGGLSSLWRGTQNGYLGLALD